MKRYFRYRRGFVDGSKHLIYDTRTNKTVIESNSGEITPTDAWPLSELDRYVKFYDWIELTPKTYLTMMDIQTLWGRFTICDFWRDIIKQVLIDGKVPLTRDSIRRVVKTYESNRLKDPQKEQALLKSNAYRHLTCLFDQSMVYKVGNTTTWESKSVKELEALVMTAMRNYKNVS